ncbi:MAG: C-GCAxxG-C-C family protein [Spirochaetia bacterium]
MENKTVNGKTLEQAKELAYKAGWEGENQRMCCSQEAFHGISTALGIRNKLIFQCLSAFEGGSAITTEGTCGAVCGALAAFSYYFGRTYEQWEKKEMVCDSSFLGQELIKRFRKEHGSIICGEILEKKFGRTFDFMKEEDLSCYEEMGGHARVCPDIVGRAAQWAVELLWDKIPGDVDLSEVPEE